MTSNLSASKTTRKNLKIGPFQYFTTVLKMYIQRCLKFLSNSTERVLLLVDDMAEKSHLNKVGPMVSDVL